MSVLRSTLAWLGAILAGIVWLRLDPTPLFGPEALRHAGLGLLAALGGTLLAGASGAWLLRRLDPSADDTPAFWAHALVAGLALASGGATLLALLGVPLGLPALAAILGALALAGGRTLWRERPVALPRPSPLAWTLGALALLPGLLEALAPPTDTDEVYQHLELARQIVDTGLLPGGWLHPDGSRPLGVHLLHAGFLALGGEAAPRLAHLLIVAALARAVQELGDSRFGAGRGALPALALLGSATFLREAGMAANNHLVALALLLASEAMLRGRLRAMGAWAGVALAAKYTAAPAIAGLFLAALLPDGARSAWQRARALVLPAGLTLGAVAPWWVRNLGEGLHPLFPFAGWPAAGGTPLVFAWPEKYGVGRTALDWARLPLDVLFRADPGSFVFLGRLNLVWGALLLGAFAGALSRAPARGDVRRLLLVVGVGFVGWAVGAQLLRWLLPLGGPAALLAAAATPWRGAWALWVLALPSNLVPIWTRAAARAPVALGLETRERFLERELPAWSALQALRELVPHEARVAQLYAWHGYYVAQSHVLGSVEDHVPTRWWLATHGEDSLRALAREGVTHLLVGDLAFFPKAYPFMAPEALEEQLAGPARRLRELLLRDATRLHAAGRWEVWRLDPASKAEIQGPLPHADVPAGEQGQAASRPPGEASPEARALDGRGSPR